jgi:hypothetical protein
VVHLHHAVAGELRPAIDPKRPHEESLNRAARLCE